MRYTTLIRTTALLTLGSFAALSAHAQEPNSQQVPDPLAEAARKARAEQRNAPKPKKIYTNDDVAPAPAKTTPTPTTGPANADSANAAVDVDAQNEAKSEAYWRKRFTKARDKLAQTEKEVEVLQRELDKNEVQYYPDPQKALMQQYSRKDINDNRAKLDAKKQEVESLKKQLSDMEDELRKAGGDPGWAR